MSYPSRKFPLKRSLSIVVLVLGVAWATAAFSDIVEIDPVDLPGNAGTGIDAYTWGSMSQDALRFVDLDGDPLLQDGSDDPWVWEGLWTTSMTDFEFGIWNKTASSIPNLILLVAYRGSGADFTMSLDLGSGPTDFGSASFHDIGEYELTGDNGPVPLFGGGGNRPGDGEGSLYRSAEGVIFIDLGAGLGPNEQGTGEWEEWEPPAGEDTLGVQVTVAGTLPEDFRLHFDAYGYGTGEEVLWTNPNSSDVTTGPPVPEASTLILFGGGLIGILGFLRRKAPFLAGR